MKHATLHLKSITLASLIALAAPTSFAQAFDAVRLNAAAPGKDGGAVGAAVLAGTEYRGSDERRTLALPLLDYQWANGWFAGTSNGIGHNFSGSPDMQYGLRMTADLGRKESRSAALRGMGDIDAKAEGGGFFNLALPLGFGLTSSLRYGSGNEGNGLVIDMGAGYSLALAPSWRLNIGTAATWANAEHMQSYFGVTPAQSTTSGYAAYTPRAGLRDVRAQASFTYTITARTRVTAGLSASTLLGDAKKSPLARKQTSASGLIAVSYAF